MSLTGVRLARLTLIPLLVALGACAGQSTATLEHPHGCDVLDEGPSALIPVDTAPRPFLLVLRQQFMVHGATASTSNSKVVRAIGVHRYATQPPLTEFQAVGVGRAVITVPGANGGQLPVRVRCH